MKEKSTHFIFDKEKIIVSPDLHLIYSFLKGIELEIETILGFEKRLNDIAKQYKETIDLVVVLAKKLKDNSIEGSIPFNLSEKPETINEKLKINSFVRSKFIVLFSYLETLLRLNYSYENKVYDLDKVRNLIMKSEVWKDFYNNFCLNEKNKWYKNNKKRLKNVIAEDLRYLRNSLTHFYSTDEKLIIADSVLDEKSRKLEELFDFKFICVSPEDFYEMIRETAFLMMKKWSNDCIECSKINSTDFKERILSMNKFIEKQGAVMVDEKQLNI